MQLTGTVISIIYEGSDGYRVAEVAGEEPAIVVGTMPNLRLGEQTSFTGEYKFHPKYGRQFAVMSHESSLPVDRDDIALFLKSGFVKGIGEVLAERLVDRFGERTFQVIEHEAHLLTRVPGISPRMASDLQEALKSYGELKFRYTELMGLGLSAKQAENAEKELGVDAALRVKEDPYVLIEKVRGIDFFRADHLAQGLGIEKTSPVRVQSAVLHVLRKSLQLGNLYVKKNAMIPHVAKNLNVEEELVQEAISALSFSERICEQDYDGVPLLFLTSCSLTERRCAQMLMELKYGSADDPLAFHPETLQKFHLTKEQSAAIETVVESNVCVITGGPGTGKTTILRAMIHLLHAQGKTCLLGAPTGRAAKRMEETTGLEAKTIHRLLEYIYDEEKEKGFFQINEDNPLAADVVLIDEASMIDIFLFEHLLRGVAPGTRLVLIGDADQLPSVGPGNVLRDLISSQTLPTVFLTYHFRNEGRIADAAHDILEGRTPEFDRDEFVFLEAHGTDEAVEIIQQEYKDLLNMGYDVQVIAPLKKADLGSIALNDRLREAVNPDDASKPQIVRGDKIYRVGDRVMQTSNDYERSWTSLDEPEGNGVFNGDIGVIYAITGPNIEVHFDDGRICMYTVDELDSLDGAFAYTIHKSQGNEFDAIILPMLYSTGGRQTFMSRSLLYTGVTRAKRKVIIVGNRYTFEGMIANDARSSRATGLAFELRFLDPYYAHGRNVSGE